MGRIAGMPRVGIMDVATNFMRFSPRNAIPRSVAIARAIGAEAIQVAMIPENRDYAGRVIDPKYALQNLPAVAETVRIAREEGVIVDSLALCANTTGDPNVAAAVSELIDIAAGTGIRGVVCFVGNANATAYTAGGAPLKGQEFLDHTLSAAGKVFSPLLAKANTEKVVLAAEGCPMFNDEAMGQLHVSAQGVMNFWHSPAIWRLAKKYLPGLRNHYDHSHRVLFGQGEAGLSKQDVVLKDIEEFGPTFDDANHLKGFLMDLVALLSHGYTGDITNPAHQHGVGSARIPTQGGDPMDYIAYERAMKKFAPHCLVRHLEMEDPTVPLTDINAVIQKATAFMFAYKGILNVVWQHELADALIAQLGTDFWQIVKRDPVND